MKSGRIYRWRYSFTCSLSIWRGIVVKSLANISAVLTMCQALLFSAPNLLVHSLFTTKLWVRYILLIKEIQLSNLLTWLVSGRICVYYTISSYLTAHLVLAETSIRHLVHAKKTLESGSIQDGHEYVWSMPYGFGQDQIPRAFWHEPSVFWRF